MGALAMASCASVVSGEARELRIDGAEAADLRRAIGCARSEWLAGDPAFYDPMVGFNCYYDDGTSILLRAYEHSTSVDHMLMNLAGTFSGENQYVRGANWYAAGTPSRLRELGAALGVQTMPRTQVSASPGR
jgi:hypothetical protein